jgi:integrase
MADTLRDRFMREMTIRGYAERTKQSYLHNVELMVRRIGLHPSKITRDRTAEYFEWMIRDHKVSPSTYRQHLTAVALFFRTVLKREFDLFTEARPVKRRKLPVVLRLGEVERLIQHVHIPRLRVAVTVLYSCGLRISEAVRMETGWVVRGGRRLHVPAGKGGVDRLVPLPKRTLQLLRQHCREEQLTAGMLFPSPYIPGRHITADTVRRAIRMAGAEADIKQHVTAHTLRHYAESRIMPSRAVRLSQAAPGLARIGCRNSA